LLDLSKRAAALTSNSREGIRYAIHLIETVAEGIFQPYMEQGFEGGEYWVENLI
jgi:hypothetical protein